MGGVTTITLDSPANRNALSTRLVAELSAALTAAESDTDNRVVVLTGTGRVFCSGADLEEQRTTPGVGRLPDVLRQIDASRAPVLCRVNGAARAGGIGLLAACDITVAPAAATFAFSEVRLGVVPAVISVPCLRRMPAPAALELFLTGEVFDASRAREVGLLNAVAADEAELDREVERYVGLLIRGAPEALAATRQVTRLVPTLPFDEGLERMAELSAERFGSTEGAEGLRAFADKRDAAWVPASRRSS